MTLSNQTKSRIEKYTNLGYQIIIGSYYLPHRQKWQGYECVRLCLTNSKNHGWPIRTVWAVKPTTNQ
jgi:hypothetical protein